MIHLDSLAIVFFAEALLGFVLLSLFSFIFFSRRKRQERQAVGSLVKRLHKVEDDRSQELTEILQEICELAPDQLETVLKQIASHEKSLYQQIFRLFLNRDVQLLEQIDQRIREMSKPYHELLKNLPNQEDPALAEALQQAEQEIARLKIESEHLAEQLEVAMGTIEQVSAEYSNMFGQAKPPMELEAAQEKIRQTLRNAGHQLQQIQDEEDEIVITMDPTP